MIGVASGLQGVEQDSCPILYLYAYELHPSPLQKEFDKLLPNSRAVQAIDEAEKLSKHLQERY